MFENIRQLVNNARQNKLFRNSLNLMLASGVGSAFGFLFWAIVARSFAASTVGTATTLLSASLLIGLLGMAGFDTIFVRLLPKSDKKSEQITNGLLVSGLASGLLATAFCFAAPLLAPRLGFLAHHALYLTSFVALTVLNTWSSLTNAALVAYRRTGFTLSITTIFSMVKLSLPLIVSSGSPMTIFTLVGIAQSVNVVLGLAVLARFFGYRPTLRPDLALLRQTAHYGLGMYIANTLNLLPDALLPIIVINNLGPAQAAYFYVAFAIANLLYTIAFATNQVLLAETAGDEERFAEHARKGLAVGMGLQLPAIALVFVSAPWALRLFGSEYAHGAVQVLRIMAVSGLLVAAYSFLSFIFKHTRNIAGAITMTAVNAAAILILAIALAGHGLVGIGWAWLLGTAIAVAVGGMFAWRGKARS